MGRILVGESAGARLCPQDPVGLLEVALLADGVAPGGALSARSDRAFGSPTGCGRSPRPGGD
ncbi:MAG: hypothetical protein U0841_16230 [Chloroflexia bacterium]